MVKLLFDEFIHGHDRNLSKEEEEFLDNVLLNISVGHDPLIPPSFLQKSSQSCKDLFISKDFRQMNLTSTRIPDGFYYQLLSLGPSTFSTDFGSCCTFVPGINLKPMSQKTVEDLYHTLESKALLGQANGMNFLLNAEQFNYAYYGTNSGGFTISLHDHRDKPMTQFSSKLIFTGTETQMNLKPALSYVTDNAISIFTPEERGCYADGEANLTYLPFYLGFRYEMNNCLIDQGVRDIVWNCRCIPYFGLSLDAADKRMQNSTYLPRCRGKKLLCANTWAKSMGMKSMTDENESIVPEAFESPEKIGDISKPNGIKCMPACNVQENNNQMSIAAYPQRNTFFHQKLFCDLASHILQKTCQFESRAYFLKRKQPLLCAILKDFDIFFGQHALETKIVSFFSQ